MTQRLRFFGGKGGVGKSTCAVAAAREAARSRRVLVVSTDPAHSLGDVLGQKLGRTPRSAGRNLDALELNADRALDDWLAARKGGLRTIALRGTYFDEEDVDRFLALSLPGVDELIGLREIGRLLRTGTWDEVIVDTAPTGHTLRLLAMPETLARIARVLDDMQEKHRVLTAALGGRRREDAAELLIEEIDREARELTELVRDPTRTQFSWVLLPEALSIEETRDGLAALEAQGIPVAELVVNNVTPPGPNCDLCDARRREESKWISAARRLAAGRPVRTVEAMRPEKISSPPLLRVKPISVDAAEDLQLLIFGGKGGTGKTTCAAASALAIADRHPDRRILLLSTDPAHSLGDAFAMPLGDDELRLPDTNLWLRELDAARAFDRQRERYRQATDELFDALRGGSRFDAAMDRRIVHDLIELAPPGIDELFAILTVTDALLGSAYDLVILDTAPTGHALRLLELPAAAHEWVRALLRILVKYKGVLGLGPLAQDLVDLARGLRSLRGLLADPKRARFVAVTRAAALPLAETRRLVAALDRLDIALSAVLVNALTPPGCTRCRAAAAAEAEQIGALARSRPRPRAILVSRAVAPPPRGVAALRRFGQSFALR
jgi:arsenite-transporting ATPase